MLLQQKFLSFMMLFSGLCRTSEIFGVSEYVLGKLHYTEDKAFQGLSVTSHKWVPITEVSKLKCQSRLQ